MTQKSRFRHASPPNDPQPRMLVVIDTEEEFDWRAPLRRDATAADNLHEQWRAQDIMESFGARPLYVVDEPAAQAPGAAWLAETAAAGRAEIGAHLHPWTTPPFAEALTPANSYAGNLPPEIERAKLRRLTDVLTERFGAPPRAYRAGRYGFGPNTPGILAALGYRLDLSTCPHMSFEADGGPRYYGWPDQPFWADRPGGVLSVPATVAFSGLAQRWGPQIAGGGLSRAARRLRLAGPAARFGLLERARLSPEVGDGPAMIRIMRAALARGDGLLTLTWHSSTLLPGRNIYTQTPEDVRRFLDALEACLSWFKGVGGRFTGAEDIIREYS